MKNWIVNTQRIQELMESKEIRAALDVLQARKWDVLRIALYAWGTMLVMTFSLLLTIRLALSIPL